MTQDTEDVVALDMTPTGAFKLPRWQYQLRAAAACLEADPPLTREFRKSVSDMLGRHQTAIQSLSDRIDVLVGALALIDRQAEVPTKPMLFVGTKRRQEHYLLCYALSSIKDTARAALHQEGIAP